jgi:hypothetical protein
MAYIRTFQGALFFNKSIFADITDRIKNVNWSPYERDFYPEFNEVDLSRFSGDFYSYQSYTIPGAVDIGSNRLASSEVSISYTEGIPPSVDFYIDQSFSGSNIVTNLSSGDVTGQINEITFSVRGPGGIPVASLKVTEGSWRTQDLVSVLGLAPFSILSAGDDEIYGSDLDDEIDGGEGDDIIWGGAGSDYLSGNEGINVLRGESGSDSFSIERSKGPLWYTKNGIPSEGIRIRTKKIRPRNAKGGKGKKAKLTLVDTDFDVFFDFQLFEDRVINKDGLQGRNIGITSFRGYPGTILTEYGTDNVLAWIPNVSSESYISAGTGIY